MSLEMRITELETRLAFQDDTLQQLSDEVLAQNRLIERLQRQVEALATRQRELAGQVGQLGGGEDEPPPPHY
ncbi:SlyX family protein [Pseudomonas sp. NW5]|uniref:SlyX family protein n=1 Tax=Pseudomonas sp. NW5 TaxID=2934934 RepID=UPI002020314E|nr:SlyX family protein [Pseudomonas sp. NW5]MCL7461572.1 SlyX family protein [Pseudomonas sp. NW5]